MEEGMSSEGIPAKKRKVHKNAETPNPLISRTEKCKVCDEPAAIHIHYGAVTCFSCRAFFRRSIQNHSSEAYRCRKESDCDITLKSRKSCQKCRFEKCIKIGMKSNWVLSEEERFHRFRKQRERGELQNQQIDVDEAQEQNQRFSPDQWDQYSPHSSNGYGGEADTDNEANYFLPNRLGTSPNQTFHSLSSSNSPPTIKLEMDGDPLPMFGNLAMGFSLKSDPTQRFGNTPTSTFSSTFQHDEALFPPRFEQDKRLVEPLNLMVESYPQNREEESPYEEQHEDQEWEQDQSSVCPRRDFPMANYLPKVSIDEFSQIQCISQLHDTYYKSISFGEELIKEMVMSSVFKIPLSPNATMTAYRLMIQRVTRVAQGLDSFINLPCKVQSMLLKQNADLIVSLRGAVFFEKRKGGLDQILISMGVDDLVAAMNLVTSAVKTTTLQRIDYSTFNSLQKVGNDETEMRYNELLEKVGVSVSFDIDLVKILSYILLFTVNPEDTDFPELKEVVHLREQMIAMMQRYILAKYQVETSSKLFSGVLRCISYLQELTWIKKQRALASHSSSKVNLDYVTSNAQKD